MLNGADVLQKIRVTLRRPDLILIDLKMPVLGGWDFLAVREGDPFPVIVLSGERDSPPEIAAMPS